EGSGKSNNQTVRLCARVHILTCVFRKVMLYTPPKVSLFGIRKLLSISHAAFFPYEPLRNTNYETMTRSGGYELRKIYVLAGLNDGRPLPGRGFSVLLPCHYRSLLVPIQAFNGGLSQAILPIRTHSSGKVVAKVSEPGSPKAQPSH